MKLIEEISVFFPAYNEEANIKDTILKAKTVLQQIAEKWEIIVIDDGSKDKTGDLVKNLSDKDKRIRLLTHNPNRGYGAALKTGLYNSKFNLIAFTDADGQFDFREIKNLFSCIGMADIVVGYRINRQDPVVRKLFGFGWTALANLFLGIGVKDVDCGFKLIKKKVVEQIPLLKSDRGGMISPELLARAKKLGFKIVEVGVHHFPRKEGKQTGANMKVIFKSFVDLGKLWWQIR